MKKIIIPLFFMVLLAIGVSAVCTVTLNKAEYKVGETATAQMSCSVGNEAGQSYILKWYDNTLTNFHNSTGTTPALVNTPFFASAIIPTSNSGSANLTGTNLEGSDTYTVVAVADTDLVINNFSLSTSYLLGRTSCVRFHTYINNTNVEEAHCVVGVSSNIGGAPVARSDMIQNSIDGINQFCQEVDADSFDENKSYVFEVSCHKEVNGTYTADTIYKAFNTGKWLKVNTITDKNSYTLSDNHVVACANVTNLQSYRIPLSISYEYRCGSGDNATDRVVVDTFEEIRGISASTTQNQCALLDITNIQTIQNKTNTCYASTQVTVLSPTYNPYFTYATTSSSFNITSNSLVERSEDSNMLIGLFLLPLAFILLLLIGGFYLDEKHVVLKWGLFLLIPPSFWASMHMGMLAVIKVFPSWTEMIDNLAFYTQVTTWISVIVFSYLLIYFVYVVFKYLGELKRTKHEEGGIL